MMLPGHIFSLLVATTGQSADARFQLGDPVVSETSFELPLEVPARALANLERHDIKGSVVFFFPGVSATPKNVTPAHGPIERLRIKSAERGVVLIVVPRLLDGQEPAIELAASLPSRLYASYPNLPTARLAAPPAAPSVDTSTPARSNELIGSALHPRPDVQPALTLAPERSTANVMTTVVIAVLGLLSVLGLAYHRRKKVARSSGPNIDVLATKALGGKQRLLVVEACGERLLLAASDKELHLIKALSSDGDDGTSFVDELSQSSRPETAASEDLAGLLRLTHREKAEAHLPAQGVAA